ncbi:MAG TPA: glycosyltransferase family 4 protein [Acidobacteriaceae bacterium]|nr:glycosyltransferase family 4 protein [Acidobacteriaceae bacterium]
MEVFHIPSLQVIQAVSGTFHHFDLARELESLGYLKRIYSTFPWTRLQREGVAREHVRTFPWIHAPLMGAFRYVEVPRRIGTELALANVRLFDAWVASRLEECDAFVAISGSGLKTGGVAKRRGAKYVCDRGSSHIQYQKLVLEEEFARWGLAREVVDPRIVAREEAEYAQADAITVPSEFARRTFLEMGIAAEKLVKVPYGVRLDRFLKVGEPASGQFNVLFAGTVSIRKGIPYLLEAFNNFKHPRKKLRLAGPLEPEMRSLLSRFDLSDVEVLGRQPQDELARWMSQSHVMVLPSIEEGLALVQGQALACGCPLISSFNTGGEDLFSNGVEGFLVPIRSPEAICERLTQLADEPELRQRMSEAALMRVQSLGGWREYGRNYARFLERLTGRA